MIKDELLGALLWIKTAHHKDGCGYSRQPNPYGREADESKCTCGKYQITKNIPDFPNVVFNKGTP